ncbi:Bax inhibitor-1/YccA family protein, partial [Candidatus Peregrinibacteria bacterium]|nr:Bax inhibitor-1/YccA family protein [Candidatus Peregrinibacteria bacterium]
ISSVKTGIEPTFFGKVMTFFALAILSSAAGVFITSQYWMEYFYQQPALMYVAFIVELAIVFTSRLWSTKIPLNRFMFVLFTFITGVTVAPLISIVAHTPEGMDILSKALLATGLMFTATAIFGWTTKIDLSGLRGFLMIGLIGMIVVGLIGIFMPWSNTAEMIYSGIGVLLFTGFIAYDFQKIKQYPEDRYIDAALALYLDIFNLFMYILRLILASRRR